MGKDLLREWLESARERLVEDGISWRFQKQKGYSSGIALDLDGKVFVGTVCFWPPETWEFQFNARDSGDVLFLETKRLSSLPAVARIMEELLRDLSEPS